MKRILLYLFDSIVIRLVLRVQRKLHNPAESDSHAELHNPVDWITLLNGQPC